MLLECDVEKGGGQNSKREEHRKQGGKTEINLQSSNWLEISPSFAYSQLPLLVALVHLLLCPLMQFPLRFKGCSNGQ